MKLHEPSLTALEYPKVLERLARHTSFSAGRELALALRPVSEVEEVRRRQAATSETVRLLKARSPISVGGAHDLRPLLERAEREGNLDAAQFLDVLATLQAATQLQRALQRLDLTFPMLQGLAPLLHPLPALQQAISRTIGPQGEVLDSASPRLAAIRSEIHTLQGRLNERMQSLLGRYRNSLQEGIITLRQGRYVLAVKAGNKRSVPGLVHDQSASGATLFIEPMEVVELGNDLRETELAEEEEVRRILHELSEQVAALAAQIRQTVETLAQMDMTLAKARYSMEMDAVEPALVVRKEARLITFPPTGAGLPDQVEWSAPTPLLRGQAPLSFQRARHPLLDPATVVPIGVELGGAFHVLVITGPNTGGKTVALKTVGLMTLMAQAGLHLPAAAGSRVAVMEKVFADIGDEQSIEQSLSTFSAHMKRIIQILEQADDGSLVLLDELGAGTDPVEGSALAQALIERLLERGCLLLVTTHHSELKAYAYATPGVQNSSVEFNVETLSPTYVLTIGLPGRSNALAIAGRLGLNQDVIERARQWLSDEDIQVDSLLGQIQQESVEMRSALEEARERREHAQNLERRLEREIRDLEKNRHDILAQTRAEAEKALSAVREQVEILQRQLASSTVPREWLSQANRQLEEAEKAVPQVPPAPPEPQIIVEDGVTAPAPGDAVWIESLSAIGEVLSTPDTVGTVEVQVGSFKVRRPMTDLRRASRREERSSATTALRQPAVPSRNVPLELELRGFRVADVEESLDRYLNDAYLAGMPFVRIIHGKGTGVLRKVVREILSGHPLVSSFEGAPDRDGGEGVTVAHLTTR